MVRKQDVRDDDMPAPVRVASDVANGVIKF